MGIEIIKKFSPYEAIEYSKKGLIEEWVHYFLNTAGKNTGLSDGLKKQKRYWAGPVEINLNRLARCCGPEKNMEFPETIDNWEKKINEMRSTIRTGWIVPPLIVEYRGSELSIRDGNHRYDALIREKIKKYWVIIWYNSMEDFLRDSSPHGHW